MTASMPSSDASIQHNAKTSIVTLTDRDLSDQIAGQPRGRRDGHMMLDFTHVRRLGAAGLTALLALGRRMRAGRGRLSLLNLGAHIHGVFTVAGLDTLFASHTQKVDPRPPRE